MSDQVKNNIILAVFILILCGVFAKCAHESEKEITKRTLMDACINSPHCEELPDGIL